MDLGDKIKELRKQKGMTQADLGLLSVCAISQYLIGNTKDIIPITTT